MVVVHRLYQKGVGEYGRKGCKRIRKGVWRIQKNNIRQSFNECNNKYVHGRNGQTQEITDARQEVREEGRQEGRQEGREEGRQEGIKEGEVRGEDRKKIEIAKKMLEAKIDIEKISEFTGLTIEEVEKLKENND